MNRDPRGQKLPVYIAQLAEHLANEQTILSNELAALRKSIKEIIGMQQNYTELAGVMDKEKVAALAKYAQDNDTVMLTPREPEHSGCPHLSGSEAAALAG